jgi:hypothetical protein
MSADSVMGNTSNPQSLNLYSYVMNNPTRYVDPTGNTPDCPQCTWSTTNYQVYNGTIGVPPAVNLARVEIFATYEIKRDGPPPTLLEFAANTYFGTQDAALSTLGIPNINKPIRQALGVGGEESTGEYKLANWTTLGGLGLIGGVIAGTESGSLSLIEQLPAFNGQTSGILVPKVPPKPPVLLESGPRTGARFPYSQADGHVETLGARWMRDNGVTDAIVYHNNPKGTCGNCDYFLPTFLEQNSTLRVIPPKNAVAPSSRWISIPKTYTGNSRSPY